ncbi:MAG: YbjN domain-containing protein [Parasphingorhabdus sp.]|nr:YbjN domain-containing protein [Parasphingorhabdus sp.]
MVLAGSASLGQIVEIWSVATEHVMLNNRGGIELDEAPPVDMLSAFFEARGWQIEERSEEEISLHIKGSWTSYMLRAIWRREDQVLQLLLLPELRVPEDRRAAVYEVLALINEQLWLGHFDIWSDNSMVVFRHAMILGAGMLSVEQAQSIVDSAIDEWERFYPVFQFILWSDKTPREAIDHAMIDTQGEA